VKHLCTSARLHGVIYQKTLIFGASAMRRSNLTEIENVLVRVLDKLRPEEEKGVLSTDVVDTTRTRQSYMSTLATPLNRLSPKMFNEEFWNKLQGVPFIKCKC
jgi:hypothetical protein